MPFVRVHGVISDGRRLDCVVSDAPPAAQALVGNADGNANGNVDVGTEADAATAAAADAATAAAADAATAAAADADATDASAPAGTRAVLSTDGSAHVGCEVEGGRWWIKARLEDGAWLLSRGEGYRVQNVELLQKRPR